jgi:hypothetical protein
MLCRPAAAGGGHGAISCDIAWMIRCSVVKSVVGFLSENLRFPYSELLYQNNSGILVKTRLNGVKSIYFE